MPGGRRFSAVSLDSGANHIAPPGFRVLVEPTIDPDGYMVNVFSKGNNDPLLVSTAIRRVDLMTVYDADNWVRNAVAACVAEIKWLRSRPKKVSKVRRGRWTHGRARK